MNDSVRFPAHWPVLGICGFSGSGKTTLIERLVPRLAHRGLSVAVLKHDAHGMRVDAHGKDTDRFFRAGATVVGRDPEQSFLRRAGGTLIEWLQPLVRAHDLVLVEGHKRTPLPARIWLASRGHASPPSGAGDFEATWTREDDRLAAMLEWIDGWLPAQHLRRPLRAGLLIGGDSGRMGSAKQRLEYAGRPWASRVARALRPVTRQPLLLGAGEVPSDLSQLIRLPDAPDLTGPIAGLVAALRWDPHADWVFAACDMPLLDEAAVEWLLAQRAPGRWAVIPRRDEGVLEPLAAWYDARMLEVLEGLDRPVAAADHAKAHTPQLSPERARAWRSFNSPQDLEDL